MSVRSESGAYTAAARRLGQERAGALEGVGTALDSLATLRDAIGGDALKALVEEHTAIMLAQAQDRAKFDIKSDTYWKQIAQRVFENTDGGFSGVVFVRPYKLKFDNIPLWLEYGTRLMRRPRPHLLPTLVAGRERFSRAVERLLSRAVAS